MTRYLTVDEICEIHLAAIDEFGGTSGVRDRGAIESAVAQPQQTFDGELHSTLVAKAAALGYSLVLNHAFVDGNKRVGFAAMKVFLRLNNVDLQCSPTDGERVISAIIEKSMTREELVEWLDAHCESRRSPGE